MQLSPHLHCPAAQAVNNDSNNTWETYEHMEMIVPRGASFWYLTGQCAG